MTRYEGRLYNFGLKLCGHVQDAEDLVQESLTRAWRSFDKLKDIKAAKLKVQAQIQGEQVRVSGKKRDDLQQVIALLREANYGLPLQFVNFRD